MTPAQKSVVITRLRQGYGVEDIALQLDVPADTIRGLVKTLQRQRILNGLIGVDQFRNHDALKIMGIL